MKNEIKKAKYALITGATSGIGYELAKQVAKDGYNLILVARDGNDLNKIADELSQFSIEVKIIVADLFVEDSAKRIYDDVKKLGISIDILINDAGQGQYGKFTEVELGRHMNIIRLNVNSLVSMTHYFLKDMLMRDEGKILQLGSEVSKTPMPMMAVYAATKAFVLSFTEALINELKDTNVTMTLLMPGATDTDFFDKAEMENTKVYREGKMDDPEEVAKLAYEALKNGERRIIGPAARKNVVMAAITPDNMIAENLRKKMEPSTKDPSETRQEPEHPRSREEKTQSGFNKRTL